jgi:hypothetical protein
VSAYNVQTLSTGLPCLIDHDRPILWPSMAPDQHTANSAGIFSRPWH